MNQDDFAFDVESIDSLEIRALAGHLSALAPRGGFPRPENFDILAVRRMAGYIHMVDVLPPAAGEAAPRFRFGIYGTRWGDITGGVHYQGRDIEEMAPPARRERFREILMRTLREQRPRLERDVLPGPRDQQWPGGLAFQRLVWPMSRDGTTIDRILLAALPLETARA